MNATGTNAGLPMLGRYSLLREIARSNDIVWEGFDAQMNRRVAVKELNLPPTLTGQARRERIERFYREARAAGKLNHPNIVTIHEVGEQGGRYFIAMEYLEGQTLRDRLSTVGALSQQEAVQFTVALCDALAYAHSQGIIHRDIKPDNVHVVPGNRVKLTDFGIARITGEQQLTMAGQVFGTPSYMSPEQVIGRDIDARSDLFSLGILLFEMLSGRKPFTGEGDSVVTIAHRILSEPTPPAMGAASALNAVIQRATAKDPNHRFSSAAEMKTALEAAALARTGQFATQGYPQSSYPPAQPAPYPTPATPAPYPQPTQQTQMYGAQTQFVPQGQYPQQGAYPPQPTYGQVPQGAPPQATYPQNPAVYTAQGTFAPHPSGGAPSNASRIAAITALVMLVVGGVGWAGSVAFSRAFRQQQAQTQATQTAGELQTAIKLYNEKQYQQAAAAFARLEQSSDKTTAENARQYESYCYVELANLAIKQNNLVDAERWLNEASRLTPDSPDVVKGLENIRQARALGTQAAPTSVGAPPTTPAPAEPGFNPNATTADFNSGNSKTERTGQELLSRANDFWRAGQPERAEEGWNQVTQEAPGTRAFTEAQNHLIKYHDHEDPFGQ